MFFGKKQLFDFIHCRKIKYLVHFTQERNLLSILKNGLIPIKLLRTSTLEYFNNDEIRLDNRHDTNSLSITFPNYRMFYKCRITSNLNWCVILFDSNILLNKECLFCYTNAANHEIISQDDRKLKTFVSFKNMFENYHVGKFPKNCTDDVQAEVLIRGVIRNYYIKKVIFNDIKICNKYNQYNIKNIKFEYNEAYFWQREYAIENYKGNDLFFY